MAHSRWTQRLIWILSSVMFGIIIDTHLPNPLYTFAIVIVFAITGLWRIQYESFFEKKLKLDQKTSETIRTTVLAFFFFLLCTLAALTIY